MREILFRGKQTDSDKWIYGVPVKSTAKDESEQLMIEYVFACEEYACRGCEYTPVIPETVGQYTGSTDKNGTKIFEGDIFRYNTINKSEKIAYGIVEYQNTYDQYRGHNPCGYVIHWERNNSTASTLREDLPFWCGDFSNGEVVGNIHDNPELLKVGE